MHRTIGKIDSVLAQLQRTSWLSLFAPASSDLSNAFPAASAHLPLENRKSTTDTRQFQIEKGESVSEVTPRCSLTQLTSGSSGSKRKSPLIQTAETFLSELLNLHSLITDGFLNHQFHLEEKEKKREESHGL